MVPQAETPGNASLPQSTPVANGRASAEVRADLADALRELLGLEVSEWPAQGFERIKERTVRSVFRGALGACTVHVKLFRAHKFADRARDSLRGQRGTRECHHLLRARALGLPAVEPLAHGMARDGDELRSFVVTATVPGGRPFTFAMGSDVHERVGDLLRRLHDLGTLAPDLHPGNLLIDEQGQPRLIDLTSFRHGGDPNLARRAQSLAFFCQPLDGGALDRGARRLVAAYLAAGRGLDHDGLGAQLALASRRWRAAALPAFGRRAARSCRHTEVGSRSRGQPRWHWHLDGLDEAQRERAQSLVADPPEPRKNGRRGAVWVADGLVMKRRERGPARKLWRAAYWLLFAGVDAPRPVALCLRPDAGFVLAADLDAPPLDRELATGALPPDAVTRSARALGRSVGRLHAHGLRNRDLKFDNLVRLPGSDRIAMTDLDGVRRKAGPDARGTGADLGRLLAAFRQAGAPGGDVTVRAFLRGWLRAHRDLLQDPPVRRVLRRAGQRAGEWARAHGAKA